MVGVGTIQLNIVKNGEFNEDDLSLPLSLSAKYKAITYMESGTKSTKGAVKYGVPTNTIPTWLLPGNKEKIKSPLQSGEFNTKRTNVTVEHNENLEKALFDWFKKMRMNNLPISGTILKEEAINYAECFKTAVSLRRNR